MLNRKESKSKLTSFPLDTQRHYTPKNCEYRVLLCANACWAALGVGEGDWEAGLGNKWETQVENVQFLHMMAGIGGRWGTDIRGWCFRSSFYHPSKERTPCKYKCMQQI